MPGLRHDDVVGLAAAGEIGYALAANAGGTLLAGLSLVGAAWLLASAIRGRWFGGMPSPWTIAGIAGTVSVVTAGNGCGDY